MSCVNPAELPKIRVRHENEVIVFCAGSFDLTHAGHAIFLEECKKLGDILVVAVGCDANQKKYKGYERPILNERIRLKMVASLKPVDYCFLDFEVSNPKQNSDFLNQLDTIFTLLKPNKYIVNTDSFDIPLRHEFVKKHVGMEMVVLERTCPVEFDGISTTKIIEKIKKLGRENKK